MSVLPTTNIFKQFQYPCSNDVVYSGISMFLFLEKHIQETPQLHTPLHQATFQLPIQTQQTLNIAPSVHAKPLNQLRRRHIRTGIPRQPSGRRGTA